jgi:DNA-binding transcriptional LysR family regulator
MELRQLRYFVAVAEAASVSGAAPRVHLSQPALSRQIHDLEAQLGLRLFERVGRRIRLTAEGQDLLERSRDLLAHADAVGERARALSAGTSGILRVGTTPTALPAVLARFLIGYRRRHPAVQVQLFEAGGLRLIELVEQGSLHLALGAAVAGGRLRHRPTFPFHVLAVAAARGRRRPTIEIRELAGAPLLLLHRDFLARQLFDAACRIVQIEPRVVLESSGPHSLIALAAAGEGIAIVPSAVSFPSNAVHAMPIVQDGVSLGGWASVMWDPRRPLTHHAASFIDELAASTRRRFPGQQFERVAPRIPPPPEPGRS